MRIHSMLATGFMIGHAMPLYADEPHATADLYAAAQSTFSHFDYVPPAPLVVVKTPTSAEVTQSAEPSEGHDPAWKWDLMQLNFGI